MYSCSLFDLWQCFFIWLPVFHDIYCLEESDVIINTQSAFDHPTYYIV